MEKRRQKTAAGYVEQWDGEIVPKDLKKNLFTVWVNAPVGSRIRCHQYVVEAPSVGDARAAAQRAHVNGSAVPIESSELFESVVAHHAERWPKGKRPEEEIDIVSNPCGCYMYECDKCRNPVVRHTTAQRCHE